MASEWYFESDGSQRGPVSSADLKSMAASGEIDADTLIWKDGLADWVPAGHKRGLFPDTESQPPSNRLTPPPIVGWTPRPAPESIRKTVSLKPKRRTLLWSFAGLAAFLFVALSIQVSYWGLGALKLGQVVHDMKKPQNPIGPVGRQELSIHGTGGVYHSRQITVKDDWSINWVFLRHDRTTDLISIWPVQGNQRHQIVDIGRGRNGARGKKSGIDRFKNEGTYILQISASSEWSLSVNGEIPGQPNMGVDVQPGHDKFATDFLQGAGMK